MKKVNLSVVIPAKNEEESVKPLYLQLTSVLKSTKKKYEIIFIDDGSKDKTYEVLTQLRRKDKKVKIIKHRGNFGKSVALQNGFNLASGEIIFTLDADLQDDPKEIPHFLKKLASGYDLVSGWKKIRHDPLSKVIPSRILNWATAKITGVDVHDINCGFKAYRRDVVKSLNLYGELYRFIPIIAASQNFTVGEIPVSHRERRYGKSKFGIERNIKGLLDLITIVFLTGYLKRPGHFFGTMGIVSFSVGFTIGIYITYIRLISGSIQYRLPLLFLGVLSMIVGVQLITTGLLAELMVNFSQKNEDADKCIDKVSK